MCWGVFDSQTCVSRTCKPIHMLSQHWAWKRTLSSEAWHKELSYHWCVKLLSVEWLFFSHQLWVLQAKNQAISVLKGTDCINISSSSVPRMVVYAGKCGLTVFISCVSPWDQRCVRTFMSSTICSSKQKLLDVRTALTWRNGCNCGGCCVNYLFFPILNCEVNSGMLLLWIQILFNF